ncbi:hypothetical protein [Janibacter alittae]|uniref:Uncharacterized protein n=1 Tax=Janibacter alittae TaxID=3115209 RepID=A0ABZ2MJI8_9MICO
MRVVVPAAVDIMGTSSDTGTEALLGEIPGGASPRSDPLALIPDRMSRPGPGPRGPLIDHRRIGYRLI